MANIDTYLHAVAEAKAKGDTHAVKWLTACWMPYSLTVRASAKGNAVNEAIEPVIHTGPVRNGKIVFHTKPTEA